MVYMERILFNEDASEESEERHHIVNNVDDVVDVKKSGSYPKKKYVEKI